MEREACVCDHGYERSDLCAEIIIIIINKCGGTVLIQQTVKCELFRPKCSTRAYD